MLLPIIAARVVLVMGRKRSSRLAGWRLPPRARALRRQGDSLCTFEIETVPDVSPPAVKLSITHAMERPESKFIQAVSGGWPSILSNLKSLLETGEIALQPSKGAA